MDNLQFDETMIVVIPQTDNLEELDNAWNKYQSLPIQLMQHSDDAAIKLYGVPNRTIYEKQKAKLLMNLNDYDYAIDNGNPNVITSEGFVMVDDEEHVDKDLKKKIEQARSLNSDTMVIIYPLSDEYPYTMDDLTDMFMRYNNLSMDLKRLSDQECINLFGANNLNMYAKVKNELFNLMDAAPESFDPDYIQEADTPFNNYFSAVKKTSGLLNLLERKLQLSVLKNNGTLLESTIAEDSLTRVDDSLNKERQLSDCVPEFVPFFTPTEIEDIVGDDLTEEDAKFIQSLKNSVASGFKNFDSKGYYTKLSEVAQNDFQSYNINMIRLGWNPNLKLSESSFDFARTRMISYLNEYYKINLVDIRDRLEYALREDKTHNIEFKFNPVYLVAINGQCYISIDSELSFLYYDEQNFKPFDLLPKDEIMRVFCVFVDNSTFMELKKHINDGRYNAELFNALRDNVMDNKRICSIFIDVLSAMTNLDRTNDPKVYYIYKGKAIDYTADRIIPTLNAILSDTTGMIMRKFSSQEALQKVIQEPSVAIYKTIRCNESENATNEILDEIRFLYTPNSVLVEAKSFPVRMSSKGVVFDLPTRVEEEYQTVHKALLAYEEQKNYDAMKESLAHLWYLNLLCERKINRFKDKDNKTDKLKVQRDTRARILNDFKKYLKLVISNDKEFDFTSYFAKSKYNDRSIFVNSDTLKYTGKAVAAIVKSLITKKH